MSKNIRGKAARAIVCAMMALIVVGCATRVTVTSNPSGAHVRGSYGDDRGTTPTIVPSPGMGGMPKSYKISKVGYDSSDIVVTRDTKSPVHVVLEKEVRSISLSSKPAGAEVFDAAGVLIGETPVSITVTDGPRTCEVKKFGYESKAVKLSEDSPSSVDVNLGDPISGMVLMQIVVGENGLQVKASMVYSERDVIERSPTVKAVRRLTDFSQTRWVGGFSLFPEGNRLIMDILDKELSPTDKPRMLSNLWAMDVGGAGGLERWTEGAYLDEGPSFSGDGAFVYFGSNRAGKNALFRMSVTNLKGLGMVTPGTTADSFPQVGPDGVTLMWTAAMGGSDIPQLWSMPLENGLPSGLPMQIREGREPRWSPKGDLILYTAVDRNIGKTKIWTMGPDGSRPTQLTTGSGYNDINPFWFPDGSKILFASDRGVVNGRQNYDIWVMDADGAHPKQLTTNGSVDDRPIVTADGRTVYFRSNRGLKWDVWVMEIAQEVAKR